MAGTDTPHGTNLGRLSDVLTDLARSAEPGPDVDNTVRTIVDAVSATVPHAEHVGISLAEAADVRSVATSSALVAALDAVQGELSDGPSVDLSFREGSHRTGDLSRDGRWPRFAEAASERGVASLLALRLFTTDTRLGTLNLYSTEPDAFDTDTEHLAELFAAQASMAITRSHRHVQMHAALGTRDVIGMAKGILMQRHHIEADEAFGLLVRASQHTNRKLREVAEWLVDEQAARR